MKRRPGTKEPVSTDLGFIFEEALNKPVIMDNAPTALGDMTEGVPGINGTKFYIKHNGKIYSLPLTEEV